MSSSVTLNIDQGWIKGVSRVSKNGKSFVSFRGIPYGRPPIGELRFKDPEPAGPWEGTFEAFSQGNKSLQTENGSVIGNEDCLYLNVHTPKIQNGEISLKYPVIVNIHGGGFMFGSGNEEDTGPDYIVEQDCVFVSFNYRLGVLGFLNLDISEAPGNLGLKDQLLLLKWVRKNISKFGGDENNVTLLGISAGAMCVEMHTLSKLSQGFFHKATMQSGTVLYPGICIESYNIYNDRLLKKLGYDGSYSDNKAKFEFIKNIDATTLVQNCDNLLQESDNKNAVVLSFFPTVGKVIGYENFIEERPKHLLASGKFAKIPMIVGMCENEGLGVLRFYAQTFMEKLKNGKLNECVPDWVKQDRESTIEEIKNIYGRKSSLDVENFITDLLFGGPIKKSLYYRLKHDQEVYYYLFAYDGGINFTKRSLNLTEEGACHADDCNFIGPNSQITEEKFATPEDKITMKKYIEMWTDFAKYGNPTPKTKSKVTWKPITKDQFNVLVIDKDITMESEDRFHARSQFSKNFIDKI